MNTVDIAVLGAIAGFTIFLGMPIGRLRSASPTLRAVLNAITIGILVFLLWDVLDHAHEPVGAALTSAAIDKTTSFADFFGLAALLFVMFAVGLVGLAFYDARVGRRVAARASANGEHRAGILRLGEQPSRLAFMIAVGIGLHNFSEGLAIGQSAAAGQISLALVLVIGFGLHNATEGFGITAPLAGDTVRPSWGQLALLGIIGGGPTVVGTLLGQVVVNDAVSVAFLALAAGSILYVIIQLTGVALKQQHRYSLYLGVTGGVVAGFVTDFIVTAGGA
ncbi:MAG: ZIP family metal transporter [Rhodoglobus sp.]